MPVTRDAKGRAEYWCEGCGQMAHFGDGPVRWWCGWKDWRPVCLAANEKAAMPGLAVSSPALPVPVSPPAELEGLAVFDRGGRIPPGDVPAMREAVAGRVTHVPAGQGSLF